MKSTTPPPLHLVQSQDLPRGISSVRALPDAELAALWDSIVVEDGIKERLLAQTVLNYTLRPKVARSVLPMHGVILLVGHEDNGVSGKNRRCTKPHDIRERAERSFPSHFAARVIRNQSQIGKKYINVLPVGHRGNGRGFIQDISNLCARPALR